MADGITKGMVQRQKERCGSRSESPEPENRGNPRLVAGAPQLFSVFTLHSSSIEPIPRAGPDAQVILALAIRREGMVLALKRGYVRSFGGPSVLLFCAPRVWNVGIMEECGYSVPAAGKRKEKFSGGSGGSFLRFSGV